MHAIVQFARSSDTSTDTISDTCADIRGDYASANDSGDYASTNDSGDYASANDYASGCYDYSSPVSAHSSSNASVDLGSSTSRAPSSGRGSQTQ